MANIESKDGNLIEQGDGGVEVDMELVERYRGYFEGFYGLAEIMLEDKGMVALDLFSMSNGLEPLLSELSDEEKDAFEVAISQELGVGDEIESYVSSRGDEICEVRVFEITLDQLEGQSLHKVYDSAGNVVEWWLTGSDKLV